MNLDQKSVSEFWESVLKPEQRLNKILTSYSKWGITPEAKLLHLLFLLKKFPDYFHNQSWFLELSKLLSEHPKNLETLQLALEVNEELKPYFTSSYCPFPSGFKSLIIEIIKSASESFSIDDWLSVLKRLSQFSCQEILRITERQVFQKFKLEFKREGTLEYFLKLCEKSRSLTDVHQALVMHSFEKKIEGAPSHLEKIPYYKETCKLLDQMSWPSLPEGEILERKKQIELKLNVLNADKQMLIKHPAEASKTTPSAGHFARVMVAGALVAITVAQYFFS